MRQAAFILIRERCARQQIETDSGSLGFRAAARDHPLIDGPPGSRPDRLDTSAHCGRPAVVAFVNIPTQVQLA